MHTWFRADLQHLPRRHLLRLAAGLAATSILPAAALADPLSGRPRFVDYPFKLGVASGDPLADGFVIWTRLAPDPLNGGGLTGESILVRWEVARDARMQQVVRRGRVLARPEMGHAVHVDVTGLEPDRPYWYRFMSGSEASPIGRTRTFPVVGSPQSEFRLAYTSCQHFGQGYFTAYRHIVEDEPHLVVHLGDYIYESTWGPRVRFHLPEPHTIEQYRNHHALYKTDEHLQAAHSAFPFAVTWDDHEVDNDYAASNQEDNEPPEVFVKRRAAAYKAYFEHMPLRLSALPNGPDMQLYTSIQFGDLARLMILDTRQYRDDQACQGPSKFGGQVIHDCAEVHDHERTMLGRAQERWLQRGLRGEVGWRVIAQQMLFAHLDQSTDNRDTRWSDGWDGYPAARQRILDEIVERKLANVIVIGGDVHQFWVTDLKKDFEDPASPAIATEVVGTSVSSDSEPWAEQHLPQNPHVKFHAWRHRGYVRAKVTPTRWETDLRAVDGVASPEAGVRTLKSFVVENGRPGAQPA